MAKALQQAIQNYSIHMEGREYPACFTKEEFRAWKIHEKELPTQPIREWACRDCTPEYQKRMAYKGLCVNKDIDIRKVAD